MKIKTNELKNFLMTAGNIRPNPVAMFLDSIKIECTGQEIIFTKTNNNIWVKYSYVCVVGEPVESFLVNERMLNGVMATTKEHEIEITKAPKKPTELKIISGSDVIKVSIQDLKDFPAMPEAAGDKIKISKEVVERIRVAAKHISTAVNKTAMNFVSIGLDGIFATNGSIVYYHDTFGLPEVFFDEQPLSTIKSTDDMLYWTSASYDFFQLDGFTYGFIKNTVKGIDFLPIVQQTGKDFFVINKKEFIDFCTLVQYSKKENVIASFCTNGDKSVLKFKFSEPKFNRAVDRDAAIESSGPVSDFNFDSESVMLLLKTIPYEVLKFTRFENGHYGVSTTEDENYKGIIARLMPE